MRILVIAVGLVCLVSASTVAAAPAPGPAHGNSLAADAQTSVEGTVVVEVLTHVADGFLVLHTDEGGDPGQVVGHTAVGERPLQTDVDVPVETAYWRNATGNATLWVAFHRDEGEEGFDSDDPIQRDASGERVAEQVAVGKRAGNRTLVLAESTHDQAVNSSRVTVRRADFPAAGYLVLRADDSGTPGEVVGTRPLDAGSHRNVTVGVDEAFYHDRERRFSLWAVLHRSDGDGTFDAADDAPILVGDDPVRSKFDLERTGDLDEHDHEHGSETPTATVTPTSTATAESTSTPTSAPGATGTTDASTPRPTAVDRTERTPTSGSVTSPDGRGGTATGGGAGFGTTAVATALGVVVVLALRRTRE